MRPIKSSRLLINNFYFISKRPKIIPHIFQAYLRKFFLRKESLRTVVLAVTYRCNAKCKHCYAADLSRGKRREINTHETKKIIDEIAENNAINININGGEPLLRGDISEIVRYASSKGVVVSLNTNAYLLNKKKFKELRKAGLDSIVISLESLNGNLHDNFTAFPGLFNRAMNAFFYAKEIGIDVSINHAATPQSIRTEKFRGLLEFCMENNSILNLTFPVKLGRWKNCSGFIDLKDIKYLKTLSSKFPCINIPDQRNFFGRRCVAGTEKLYIDPYGNVTPCAAIQVSYGNVLKEPLSRIYERILNNALLNTLRSREFTCQAIPTHKLFYDLINKRELPVNYKEFEELRRLKG
jgi:MoaA/NifB/PqqE/SkfB family radical SAM enzyme